MKRKTVITVIAMAMTYATMMASCGKASETVNAEPVAQATEQTVLETETEETPQVSADQGEGSSISLEPTMVDGQMIYPEFPENFVKFTPIEPAKTLYCIESTFSYDNPNARDGKLVNSGMWQIGDSGVFSAECVIDDIKYYRTEANQNNKYFIVPANCLSETAPSEEDINKANQDAGNISNANEELMDYMNENNIPIPDDYTPVWDLPLETEPAGTWDDVPQDLLESLPSLQ